MEIKPLLGDDYPNVLRKMSTQKKLTAANCSNSRNKNNYIHTYDMYFVLLIDEYASQNTTREQLITIFRQSEIRIIFIDELNYIKHSDIKMKLKENEYVDYD